MNPSRIKSKKYLLGIFFSLWGNAVSIISGLATIAVASRCLAKEELGVYYIVLMITSLSVAFAGFGGRSAIIKFLSSSTLEEKEKIANLLITLRIVAIIVVSIGLVTFLFFIDQIWSEKVLYSVKWIIIPIVVMEIVNDSGMSLLAGFDMFKKFAFFQGFKGSLTGIVSILILLSGFNLKGLLLGVLAVSFFVDIALLYTIPIKYRLTWDNKIIMEILKFSGALYIAFLVSIFSFKTAEAMIVSFLGVGSLAIYGNAMRFPNLLLRMFEAIRPVILNYFSSEGKLNNSLAPLRFTSLSVSFVASILIVFAQPIILLLFSDKYLSSVALTRLLSFWVVLSLINYFLVVQLTGNNMPSKVLLLNLIQFFFVICGHYFLIPKYGTIGAASSVTIGAFITVMISAFFLSQNNTRKFLRSILTAFRPVLPLFLLFVIIQKSGPDMILSIIYWVLYIGILFATKTFTLNEIKGLINNFKSQKETT